MHLLLSCMVTMGVGERSRLKVTSAKAEFEVEDELGKIRWGGWLVVESEVKDNSASNLVEVKAELGNDNLLYQKNKLRPTPPVIKGQMTKLKPSININICLKNPVFIRLRTGVRRYRYYNFFFLLEIQMTSSCFVTSFPE